MHHNFTFDIRLNRQHTLAVWKTQRAVCLPGRYILLMLGVSSSNGSSWLCSAVWGVWMPGSVSLPACSPELPASCLSSLGLWDPSDAWTGSRTERNRKFNRSKRYIHKFAYVYSCYLFGGRCRLCAARVSYALFIRQEGGADFIHHLIYLDQHLTGLVSAHTNATTGLRFSGFTTLTNKTL